MSFSKGQIIFALVFFIIFVAVMIWAYRSDCKVNRENYKGVWLILVGIIIVFALIKILSKALH